jgi:3-oxoacyl-(acyl-carrier-protein) synthase
MKRVVITGLGVVAPNGTGLAQFTQALRSGSSGIAYDPVLESLNFSCRISGTPKIDEAMLEQYFTPLELRQITASGIRYGVLAGLQAWEDAQLEQERETPDWHSGTIFGSGTSGVDKFRESIYKIDAGETRKLGSTAVVQTMNSGVSAFLAGKLGLGNLVTSNSSACTTGTEAILLAYERIREGKATRMIAGSTSDSGPYIWAGFDAMRVCTSKHNDDPAAGSRPMSGSASGFVPGSGAGALVLESLESAKARGARIYAEVAGGHVNAGGQRLGGSMTAPNPTAVIRCIKQALDSAGVRADEIQAINGHLTATSKDALEIQNWVTALNRKGEDFPLINSLKGMTGHCLTAAGSIESVASVLQISEGFVFQNLNAQDLHPEIAALISPDCVPLKTVDRQISTIAKASFGFGDVNACIIFKKYTDGTN